MSDPIKITIAGEDKLIAALDRFSGEIKTYLIMAGKEAGEEIISVEGLQKYPPTTEANQPGRYSIKTKQKMGHYIREEGYVTPSGKHLMNSEHYGKKYYVKASGASTIIGNTASYAKYLAGEEQVAFHAARGWRKILDVAREKLAIITKIYDRWVELLIKKLEL